MQSRKYGNNAPGVCPIIRGPLDKGTNGYVRLSVQMEFDSKFETCVYRHKRMSYCPGHLPQRAVRERCWQFPMSLSTRVSALGVWTRVQRSVLLVRGPIYKESEDFPKFILSSTYVTLNQVSLKFFLSVSQATL